MSVQPTSSSSSSSSQQPVAVVAPLIRVSRKRTADPHDALLLHVKKAKEETVKFTLFKTQQSLATEDVELSGLPIVDFKTPTEPPVQPAASEEKMDAEADPLAFVGDDSINQVGDAGTSSETTKKAEDFTLNGVPLVPLAPIANFDDADEIVYDYYRMMETMDADMDFVAGMMKNEWDDVYVRFANNNELVNDEASDLEIDDDDDSNAEDNWRNDYPDEDSYEEDDYGDGDHDYYGELSEDAHRGSSFDGIDAHFGRMTMSDDRFENYYGGEDTSDDES